jgi:hypothetical protein
MGRFLISISIGFISVQALFVEDIGIFEKMKGRSTVKMISMGNKNLKPQEATAMKV